ncbi:plasma membrane SNARE protein [Drechmeria coniospora]|uniref:Plasma membrane SNARE protein n=1 Tax=Drechmeria coniospora TaxID=98403 RepID=A0A151GFU9_DRECN|nr:plasma membrane SNARE protein [Drechmeria coniospora]KYK55942.1 plasma membrane SNARE protein [Drechmeria coniospora]
MKKFGFGRKGGGDDDDESSRSALFSRKKTSSSANQPDNPYAKGAVPGDPYADNAKYANVASYQQSSQNASSSQRPGMGGQALSHSTAAQSTSAYGSPGGSSGGVNGEDSYGSYGADRYGSNKGYGSNRYGANSGTSPAAGARGPSGYGGFGRSADNAPDENRDALFSGAHERLAQKQAPASHDIPSSGSYEQSGTAGGSYYGYGEERELTAEEQEEADYQAILAEKRQLQQESSSSVSRSVQMARQANEVGQATLARLGAQGERLHNTEKNLDLAANQNKIAQDRAAELKTLNRSMFAVHVGNPFTSKQRQQKADDEVLNRHRSERDERESTRRDGFASNQRMENTLRDINSAGRQQQQQVRKKDYGKFNLEDEEGADEIEDQINEGIDELQSQVSMMNMVGRAIGREVDSQNKQIDRIMTKVRCPATATLVPLDVDG